MRNVSDKYKQATSESIVQDVTFDARITLSVANVDAVAGSSVTLNYGSSIGDTSKLIAADTELTNPKFASFEKGMFKLDGSMEFYRSGSVYHSFLSNQITDANGAFFYIPVGVVVNFNAIYRVSGLTIVFDKLNDIYPVTFQILTYQANALQFYKLYTGNTLSEVILLDDFGAFDRLTVGIFSLNKPNTRARITTIMMGVNKVYTGEDLDNNAFTLTNDVDLTCSRLPKQELSFSVLNQNGVYDTDNPTGIYQYLREKQPVKAELVAKYSDGTEEVIRLCKMVTNSEISADKDRLTIKAVSRLQNMVEEFTGLSTFSTTPKSLYNLALDVAGSGNIIVDSSLQNIYTNAVIESIPKKELLQLIALAGMCFLYEDVDGIIHIDKATNTTDEHISFDEMYAEPVTKGYPKLGRLGVVYRAYTNGTTQPAEYTPISIFDSTVNETIIIDNPLVISFSNATNIIHWLYPLYSIRNEYSFPVKCGVEYQPGDIITFHTLYTQQLSGIITSSVLTYNGTVRCNLKVYPYGGEDA